MSSKKQKSVENFVKAASSVKQYFDANIKYVLKPMLDVYWRTWSMDDVQFLTYWSDDVQKTDVLIVKEDSKQLMFEKEDYTMIVGIECIKVALIFKNSNRAG
ncbi:MAG: hypothetical protein FWE29_03555 [Defluviitaleaceae bacterium]|nr:hypothetical protein [Defluviitaleaceae bacterium]